MAMARDIKKLETAAERTLRERKERQSRLAEQAERNEEAVAAADEARELAREQAPATHVERSGAKTTGAKAAAGPAENKAAAPAKKK